MKLEIFMVLSTTSGVSFFLEYDDIGKWKNPREIIINFTSPVHAGTVNSTY